MATTSIDLVRNNLDRAAELRTELRELDGLATKEQRSFTADEQDRIDALATEIGSCDARARGQLEQEQRSHVLADGITRIGLDGDGSPVRSSLGGIRFRDDQLGNVYAGFQSGESRTATADVETRSVSITGGGWSPGTVDPLASFGREPTRVASYFKVRPVTSPTATFYSQPAGADAADAVAEGALKPESSPSWTAVTLPVAKIAHYADVTSESLDDYQNFKQIVTDEMVRGLIAAENTQVLAGNGTAPNMRGLLNVVGIQTYAPAGAEARYLSILHAATLIRTGAAFGEADTCFVNPVDYEIIAKTAATTNELIVTADPTGRPISSLWGIKLVATTGIAAGTGLVVDAASAALMFEREKPTLKVDPYSQSDKNLVRVIAEERLVIGVTKPAAVCEITYNGTA